MNKKSFRLILASFAAFLATIFASPAFSAGPKDVLKIGTSSEFETLNPLIMEQAASG